jgi:cysteine dioxygenase
MTDEMGFHLIKNKSKQKAMTLHVYAGPIDACEIYCNEEDKFKITEMECDFAFDEEFIK